ncbi:MAG: hypothetical protein V1729_00805 [Candidatus Woesearchaeota archaeon]
MNKAEKYTIYAIFMSIYASFAVYSLLNSSQWIIDNTVAMVALTGMLIINRWVKLRKTGFILFNIGFLIHNGGTFGLYNLRWGMFAYDNIVHLVGSAVAAYIIFNFIARKLHIKKGQRVKSTVVDEHKLIMIFLVIASVAMLGTVVELIEFVGFLHLGSDMSMGGLLNVDAEGETAAKEYMDTMGDIVLNILGSITGVLFYYHIMYKQRPWLKY